MNEKPKKNSEGKKKSEITHNFEKDSSLKLEQNISSNKITNTKANADVISNLSEFMKKSNINIKKELIKENSSSGSKFMMDERNILE
jgi:predicted nucleotidyltransferase